MFKSRTAVLSFILIFLAALPGAGRAQMKPSAQTQEDLPKELEHAFEKAMRTVDKEKSAEEQALKERLKGELESVARDWIAQARRSKDAQNNKLVDQKWEDFNQTGPWFHYDYFLRDSDYQQIATDVVKTDSLMVPYKGYLKAQEIMYVERKHLPNLFDTEQYFFTVATMMTVNFDYKDNKFTLAQIRKENPDIRQGWPAEITAKVKPE